MGVRRIRISLRPLLAVAALAYACNAHAQTARPGTPFITAGDWGGAGLLQTRTGRFESDGQFNIGYSFVNPYKRYTFSLTYFPWLEATFRYTEVRSIFYSQSPEFSGDQRYKDRGADLKFRLLQESRFLPALAVGFQDLLGSGLFAGEYFVASKRFGDFDVSAGVGWGTMGGVGHVKNPFLLISDRFAVREGAEGLGGQVAVLSLFGGERAGVFGGVEYHTPVEGLSLKIEYDANAYATPAILQAPTSHINFGVVVRPYNWLELSFGRERGDTTMLRLTLRTSFNAISGIPKIDPPPPPIGPRLPIGAFTPTTEPQSGNAALAPEQPPSIVAQLPAPRPPTTAPGQPGAAPTAAGQLFAALGSYGANVEWFGTVGDEAYIDITSSVGALPLHQLAEQALRALPKDLVAVTLADLTIGAGAPYARVARHAMGDGTPADDLYVALAQRGFTVDDVAMTGDVATILVTPMPSLRGDLGEAARAAADALPGQPSVNLRMAGGASATWRRDASASPAAAVQLAAAPAARPLAVAGQDATPARNAPYTPGQRQVVSERLNDGLRGQGIVLEYVELQERSVVVGLYAFRYRETARNVGLAARAVASALPAQIDVITIAFFNAGVELTRVTMLRHELEAAAAGAGPEAFWTHAEVTAGEPWWPGESVPWRYPRFNWSIGPQLRQHIGGPDRFYLYQLWVSLGASLDVTRGLTLTGQVGKNVYHNFDRIRLVSDSQLPRVRSDIKEYLQQGADNIVRLQATYLFKPAEDLYVRTSAGLLEEMYGGISGEVLYRPFGSRFALGLEVSRVRKRDYDQRFRFLDYQATTGHLSLYYDTPFSGVLAQAHMGTYLAGDRGVTFELSRRFDSGVRVGAWASFTNVSPAQFGEGSFDKGFFIVIPFDLFLTRSATASGSFGFRPLTRDGGQRLALSSRLYDLTSASTLGGIEREWVRVME